MAPSEESANALMLFVWALILVISLVLVSHCRDIALGVQQLAREMTQNPNSGSRSV